MWSSLQTISLIAFAFGNIVDASPVAQPKAPEYPSSIWSSGLSHNGKCENPIVRKEWRGLSYKEKCAYLDAVQCLYEKPTLGKYPGARNRYDDFNGAHITKSMGFFQGTGGIHFVGYFLPWHRYYVASYEKALREECGYKGGQPYWDWTLDHEDFTASPLWNINGGFGGNGYKIKINASALPISEPEYPGSTGGGCVKRGRFSKWITNVGPFENLEYNPHCLARDFHPNLPLTSMTPKNVSDALATQNIDELQYAIQGTDGPGVLTFHGAGHFSVGGSAGDVYSSSSEPTFFLHHAQIDRIWYMWESQKESRFAEINGPIAPFGTSATPNVTLESTLDLDVAGPTLKIKDLMHINAVHGPLCYRYE